MRGFADFTIDIGSNIIAHKQKMGEPITAQDRKLIGVPLWTVTAKRQFAPSNVQGAADLKQKKEKERRYRVELLRAALESADENQLDRDDISLTSLIPPPQYANNV